MNNATVTFMNTLLWSSKTVHFMNTCTIIMEKKQNPDIFVS